MCVVYRMVTSQLNCDTSYVFICLKLPIPARKVDLPDFAAKNNDCNNDDS